MKIRILLADDHPMIRAGFKSMLDKNERFEIVGEAGNGKELLAMAADASALYARNLLSFLGLLFDAKTGEFRLDLADEIIAATRVCADGTVARA